MSKYPKSDALMSLILEYRYASKSEDAFAAKEALICGLHNLESQNRRLLSAAEGAREWIAHNVTDGGYGYYRPPNPHDFSPDPESCSDAEIANHKAACDAYDKGEYVPDKRGGWSEDGNSHVLRAPWGIGSYTYDVPELRELLDAIDAMKD